ncbi:RE2 [Symbiodinium sp. CCMP2592]|nr:RE2 [Symbiodinium sp. CCMP2592]
MTEHLSRYFKHCRRKAQESMNEYITRKAEAYLRAEQALQRVVASQKKKAGATKVSGNQETRGWYYSRRSSVDSTNDEQESQGDGDPAEATTDDASSRDSWQDWQGQRASWSWSYGYNDYSYYGGTWWDRSWPQDYSYYSSWNAGYQEPEGPKVELLPSFVQGWYLLQDANLGQTERNMVQTALGGIYDVDRVAQELRNQWSDHDVKNRDHGRQTGFLGETLSDSEEHEDDGTAAAWMTRSELNEEGQEALEAAEVEAQSAMAAITAGKRTLKEARYRQHQVKLGRQYYRGGPRGNGGSAGSSSHRGGGGATNNDANMTCLKCGKLGHRAANCKDPPNKALQVDESKNEEAPFVCYSEVEAIGYANVEANQSAFMGTPTMTTAEAVREGHAILDGGATRTLASVYAIECLMKQNAALHGDARVSSVDLENTPTFGFGNSSSDRCVSTVSLGLKADGKDGKLSIHALDKGEGPILLSVATLRNLGAVLDFSNDLVVFRHLNKKKIIRVGWTEQTATTESIPQSDLSKCEELLRMLVEIGEHVPENWTKAQIQHRLIGCYQARGLDANAALKKQKTPLQIKVTQLNGAARKKADLVKLLQEEYMMDINPLMTVKQLVGKGLDHLYEHTACSPHDQVCFGRHAQMLYHEVKESYPQYCDWVMKTSREEKECSIHLRRLAMWLEQEKMDPIKIEPGSSSGGLNEPPPEEPQSSKALDQQPKAKASPKRSGYKKTVTQSAPSVSSETSIKTEVLQTLVQTVAELKEEVANMREERPRKKEGRSEFSVVSSQDNRRQLSVSVATQLEEAAWNLETGSPEAAVRCAEWNGDLDPHTQQSFFAQRVYIGGLCVAEAAIQQGVDGRLQRKGWKYQHSSKEREEATSQLEYTPEYAKRAVRLLTQELSYQAVQQECAGKSGLPEQFGMGTTVANYGTVLLRNVRSISSRVPKKYLNAVIRSKTGEGDHWSSFTINRNQRGMGLRDGLETECAFRSQLVADYCDKHGIFLDIVPGEAHWKIGACENAIKGLKEVMAKLCACDADISLDEALSTAVRTFNQRDIIRGFSPVQHALGRSPDETGRVLDTLHELPPELLVENASGEFERATKLRSEAEQAHARWQAQQRLVRAANSRHKPKLDFSPGELVFFWRTQESGQSKKSPSSKKGRFLGPARILAVETAREADGTLKPGSSVWLVRGRNLLKCCPEQLRRASPREELLETLAEDKQAPWSFTKVAEEIGGNQYQDISGEKPEVEEWHRAQDVECEAPPRRVRLTRKRPGPAEEPELMETEEEVREPATSSRRVQAAHVSQEAACMGPENFPKAAPWWDEVPHEAWMAQDVSYWTDETAAVSIEIDMPDSKRGQAQMLNNMSSYFVGAMKRRAVEVCEKRLNPEEKAQFREAKGVEVRNFVAAKAFECIPEHLQPSREQAIGMRWILTWKLKDTGERKAKARAVLLGYQDPSYEHRATTAPVMTRQTRQFQLQITANRRWRIQKGDVSGAFLQGREYKDTLYCTPTPEICEAMNIPVGSITRLKRACYGLVDAPLEWYRTVSEFLEGLGMERLWSDSCAWVWRKDGQLRGMISGHVDDFLFSGDAEDVEWQKMIQAIQQRFKWSDWENDTFVQCGVQVTKVSDGFELSQPHYLEGLHEIGLSSSRRKDKEAPVTERERSQLRTLLGGLSWHAQQVAPHVSAEVGLLLSEVSKGTVSTVLRANLLLHHTKARGEHKLKIHAFDTHVTLALYAWVDASDGNRPDGGSTQGIFIGIGPEALFHGEMGAISPISWHSTKIDRTCRSPGAAEVQAAINGEDQLYYARYQWSEILYGGIDVRNPDAAVLRIQGGLVTDSRNVFDKLQTEVLVIKGAEKKSNIELLGLKEAQARTQVHIRWVHSEAQLANALTKSGPNRELELYYRMRYSWRIVEDPEMQSARKRKSKGVLPLENPRSATGEL